MPTMHRLLLDRALRNVDLPAARSVLVVGAGHDRYSWLLPDAERYVTLDLKPFPGTNIVGDGHALPVRSSAFDCVTCIEVLEHVRRPESVVEEVARVLRPDGVVLASVPFMFHIHADPDDYSRFTAARLNDLFARFTSVDITPFGTRVSTTWDLVTTAFSPHSPLAPLRVVNNLARLRKRRGAPTRSTAPSGFLVVARR